MERLTLWGRNRNTRKLNKSRVVWLLVGALGLACSGWGCSVAPMPPDRFYDLSRVATQSDAGACRVPGVLVVNRPVANSLTDERTMVFRPDRESPELRRSVYDLWVDPPTVLLQDRLAAYLGKRGVAATVVTPDLRAHADYALSGRVVEMYRSLGNSPSVTLALDLTLVRLRDHRVLVQSSGTETLPAADIDQAVRGYEIAASNLFEAFVMECQSELAGSN